MTNKKIASNVLPGSEFDFQGVGKISNLFEMIDALRNSSSSDFAHHVNSMNNDIANWIEYCYDEKKLATKIKLTLSRASIIQIIEENLAIAQIAVEENIKEAKIETSAKSTKLKKLTREVKHLEAELEHITKQNTKKAIEKSSGFNFDQDTTHDSLKKGLAEFSFGLIIGILGGLLLGKVLGLY